MNEVFRKALLVEDEAHLAQTLLIALKKAGIPSVHAPTLKTALASFERESPDLVILDRALPDGDGLDLCKLIRDQGYRGAILMLTARGFTHDRIEGLNAGADDYLAKPFSWEELNARIGALARRSFVYQPEPPMGRANPQASTETSAGGANAEPELWACDPSRLRILGRTGWIELTPLEFKLANHLISAGGAIVSRDDLLKDVWGFTLLPRTRTVDHFMGRLRKHFEQDPEVPEHFLTVRGAGYRFQK